MGESLTREQMREAMDASEARALDALESIAKNLAHISDQLNEMRLNAHKGWLTLETIDDTLTDIKNAGLEVSVEKQ